MGHQLCQHSDLGFRIIFIGQTLNWAKAVGLWNLALGENHGPRVGVGGCNDCRGVEV
ncbi:hypothetical protein MAR_023711 [Mya arenaria]|uniref:Uncharacterized protein n=1 Tax=Mya arenaria TaxID=6604 RepID=A0ABY7DR09_MYAAR|nr:hypothetical protein MAR_023711 [Mya arenaria]